MLAPQSHAKFAGAGVVLFSTLCYSMPCVSPAECVKVPSETVAIWIVYTPQHNLHRFATPAMSLPSLSLKSA